MSGVVLAGINKKRARQTTSKTDDENLGSYTDDGESERVLFSGNQVD
jgi:hypothetical protein